MRPKPDAPAAPSAARRSVNGKAPAAGDRELSIDELITDIEERVDNHFIDMQRRLLPDALYASWRGPGRGRTFRAAADVGIFPEKKQTPIVPDVFLSLDVPLLTARKEHRSYFLWIMGKPPDVVFEFVSDRRGGEEGHKKKRYAQIGVRYYVIFDPERRLRGEVLRSYELREDGVYHALEENWFPAVGLGVRLWQGAYEMFEAEWLRWHDHHGRLIPTGAELAAAAQRRADKAQRQAETAQRQAKSAQRQAETAQRQAEEERRRIEKLEAQLRANGIDPSP